MRKICSVLPLVFLLFLPACKDNDVFCDEVCGPDEDLYVCGGSLTNNRICSLSSATATAQCGAQGVVAVYECGSGGDEAGEDGGEAPSETPGPDDEGEEGSSESEWSPDDFIWVNRKTGATVVARELLDIMAADGRVMMAHDSTFMAPLEGGHFQLKTVGRDDLAYHLGFVNEDIIRSANGIDLASTSDYMFAIGTLASKTELEITVTRSGAPHTVVIHIE